MKALKQKGSLKTTLKVENKTNITLLQTNEVKILTKEIAQTQIHEALLKKTIKIWNSKRND
jgi:uncharacterized membrane protein